MLKRNYEEITFEEPKTEQQIEEINLALGCLNRIIDWRDECTLWLWKEGKTLDDGQWEDDGL